MSVSDGKSTTTGSSGGAGPLLALSGVTLLVGALGTAEAYSTGLTKPTWLYKVEFVVCLIVLVFSLIFSLIMWSGLNHRSGKWLALAALLLIIACLLGMALLPAGKLMFLCD